MQYDSFTHRNGLMTRDTMCCNLRTTDCSGWATMELYIREIRLSLFCWGRHAAPTYIREHRDT